MKFILYLIFSFLSIFGYSQSEEKSEWGTVFYNSMSVRPLSLSNSIFAFRIYANYNTTIDRIITVSLDSTHYEFKNDTGYIRSASGSFICIGRLHKKNKIINHFSSTAIYSPRADSLIERLSSIDYSQFNNKTQNDYGSTYFIEIVKDSDYKAFKFSIDTDQEEVQLTKYKQFEKIIYMA